MQFYSVIYSSSSPRSILSCTTLTLDYKHEIHDKVPNSKEAQHIYESWNFVIDF